MSAVRPLDSYAPPELTLRDDATRRLRRLAQSVPAPMRRRLVRARRGESGLQRQARQLRNAAALLRARHERNDLDDTVRDTLVAVVVRGRPALAQVVDAFQADAEMTKQAAEVAAALAAAGVHHVVLPGEPERRRVIVVRAADRRAALRALEYACDGRAVYVAPVAGSRVGRPRRLEPGIRLRNGAARESVRVFRYLATEDGVVVSGADLGCDVQFWTVADQGFRNPSGEPIPAGSLLSPQPPAFTPSVLPPEAQVAGLSRSGEAVRNVPAALAPTHVLQVTEPIDAVYTWVDGSDAAWRQRMARAWGDCTPDQLHPLAANESRFASHDELRYSLRSLDSYASWIGRIFLVTDDQVPAWLDVTHPRVRVVSHRELFGSRGRLPTFNSHAIESQLHHIDGLAEHFLYLNDDLFFGRPVRPSSFVLSNGITQFFPSPVKITPGPHCATDLPATAAAKNNRDLILAHFGRRVTDKFQHMPHALRRSVLRELEETFPSEVAATAAAQFRSPTDLAIPSSLAHHFGYLKGRAVPGRLRYLYLDIAAADLAERLELLLRKRSYDVFCLNDHDSARVDPAQQTELVRAFLDQYFPLPSQFER